MTGVQHPGRVLAATESYRTTEGNVSVPASGLTGGNSTNINTEKSFSHSNWQLMALKISGCYSSTEQGKTLYF